MQDPLPQNIEGSKRTVHRVEHQIHWGYVVGGLGLLVLAFVLYRVVDIDSEDDENGDFA